MRESRYGDMRKILLALLITIVLLIGMLHFFTPGHLHFYHDTYRRLSYFPIVLGGLWFGLRGGLAMAVLSSIFFIPHVLLYIDKGPHAYLSELAEIILYLAAGLLVGMISGRQTRLREKYRLLSEKLGKSYERLHEETAQLIEAEKQLAAAQKFSALGKMSASLAHEIKNPLSSIKGTAEILVDDYPPEHPNREFVDILLKEIARLQGTVEDILKYSREKGAEEHLVPLSEVTYHVAALLEKPLKEKEIQLHLNGMEKAEDFPVAEGKLTQVLLNILLNSIDAVRQGEGKIRLTFVKKDAEGMIEVCDNGRGIPEQNRERVFEPFYTDKEDGTGLGLLISKKIVESLGGKITVTDDLDGGACFRIFLPTAGRDFDLVKVFQG